jgi:hypothetical protein
MTIKYTAEKISATTYKVMVTEPKQMTINIGVNNDSELESSIEMAVMGTAPPIAIKEYINQRKMAYPPITDYIDGVVKGDQAQIDKYIADCRAVKAKYPKG